MSDFINHLQERFAQGSHGVFGTLDIEINSASCGQVSLAIQPDGWAALHDDEPTVHSGLLTLLLDSIFGFAVISSLETPMAIATIDLKIDFLRDVHVAEKLLVEARVVDAPDIFAHTEGEVRVQKTGLLIARGNGSFMVGTKGPSFGTTNPEAAP